MIRNHAVFMMLTYFITHPVVVYGDVLSHKPVPKKSQKSKELEGPDLMVAESWLVKLVKLVM